MQINPTTFRQTEKTFAGIECTPLVPTGNLQRHANEGVMRIARSLGKPLLLTLDAHFVRPEQKFMQDILLKQDGKTGWHFHNTYAQYSMEEAWELWQRLHPGLADMSRNFAQAVEANSEFVSRVEPITLTKQYHLPPVEFPAEIRSTDDDWDTKLTNYTLNLVAGYGRFPAREHPDHATYVARLREELAVIARNGTVNFLPYFITLSEEVCKQARARGILMSPGRGSAAGCLLAYLLKITHLDPIKWSLSFARFLSMGRINRGKFPDIDMDFGDAGAVTAMLKEKFGDRFARICTTNTLKPKNAIRDVSRVLLNTQTNAAAASRVDAVAKSLSNVPQGMSDMQNWLYGWQDEEGAHAGELDINPLLANFFSNEPDVARGVTEVLGIPRSLGRHASAYCLSDTPICDELPMCVINEEICTQYTMGPVEALGFLKIDFLGLNTLKDISGALAQIKARHGMDIDIYSLPDGDPATMAAFQQGRNETVFQFNAAIGIDLCKRARPTNINDLSDITAAGRPGTMYALMDDGKTTLIDAWLKRRAGKELPRYIHPSMEDALKSTLGVALYQEQVMAMFQQCCGFSEERADEIREFIGKKKKDRMDAILPEIRSVLRERGWSPAQSESFISLCVASSSYSFNRSHSAAYAYLGYVCQFLKTHFPLEWWTSVLQNSSSDDIRENAKFCRDFIITPDVNQSDMDFYIIDGARGKIVYPLGMVRGVKKAAAEIASKRPFASLQDFYERIDRRLVHRGIISSLIWAGAFDRLCFITDPEARNDIFKAYLELRGVRKEINEFAAADKFNCLLRQNYALPLNAADFSTTIAEMTGLRMIGLQEALALGDKRSVVVAGSIDEIKQVRTKKGEQMAFVRLADRSVTAEMTIFPMLFADIGPRLKKNEVVLIWGKTNSYNDKMSIIVDKIRFFGEVPLEQEFADEFGSPLAAPETPAPMATV